MFDTAPFASQPTNGFKKIVNRLASGLDPALLLVWLLSVPAISPLIQPTLTRSADGLLHLYRIVALDHAIRQGVLFPRWLPDLAFGYGMPLFVFYAPLSYYLTEGLNLLGLGPVNALTVSFALALFVSGTGVYLFVKDLLGSQAGILAGVTYVYAPYQLYNTLERGSLPIAWAGAMFPLAFWAFGRLIKRQDSLALPLSALACGAALLVHNISNLIFLPLLACYILLALWFRFDRRTLLRAGLALMLGLGLAAFFLGPALLEKEYAQVERVITPPDFDYRSNFVTLGDLFSLPEPANTGLLNPDPLFTLGLAQVGLAIIGLMSVLVSVLAHRVQSEPGNPPTGVTSARLMIAAFASLSLAGAIFMMLPVSRGVWDSFPLLAFVQQPHRLLSLAAF
ncbi:MAG TPA: 6-pyruvoyl-tetrahydropterin synthase-related protein, partial [Anaerolineae bacterium]